MFTQLVPQTVSGQLAEQELVPFVATQNWPALQALPQAPQLAASELTLTQAPLQLVRPVAHWQVPFTQVWPVWHMLPQLAVSLGGESLELHAQGKQITNRQPNRAMVSRFIGSLNFVC